MVFRELLYTSVTLFFTKDTAGGSVSTKDHVLGFQTNMNRRGALFDPFFISFHPRPPPPSFHLPLYYCPWWLHQGKAVLRGVRCPPAISAPGEAAAAGSHEPGASGAGASDFMT